jgi:flagella basal body P-ring formation protein FlgA
MTRRIADILSLITVALVATTAPADVVTLTGGSSDDAVIRLGEVARLDGPAAQAQADLVLGAFDAGQTERSVTLTTVRGKLTEQGVHWGRLTLRGPEQVAVRRVVPTKPDARTDAAVDAALIEADVQAEANPAPAVTADGSDGAAVREPAVGLTLRQLVRQRVERMTAADPADLRIRFDEPDDPAWNLSELDGRFEIQPAGEDALGRLPLTVRQYRGTQLIATHRLRVEVARRVDAVLAARPIQRGQTITTDDLRRESRWLDSSRVEPAVRIDPLVGQVAARTIRNGSIIEPDDVERPALVQRGELITVRAISGGLVVKTVARAAEDGARGQIIEVRSHLPRDRRTYHARVSGPREAVLLIDAVAIERTARQTIRSEGGDS